jgi:hypothetical protein
MGFETIAAAAVIAGSAISAYGSIRQGKKAEEAAEANAQIAEKDARMATEKAEYDAATSAKEYKVLMGRQKALYAKAGVSLNEGSPLLMMSYQAGEAERERQAILYGGKTAEQASLDRANLFRMTGSEAKKAGYITGGSTFLTSLGSAGLKMPSSTTVW